ncbi:hypothetical protein VHEMI10657 [[Torrubiella] hemipterigena]|uniref:Uncharacterized protein n=1 Tax=[Torrubiella] hemipterigena TaxID=1531966 RepID=A0A0A1TJB6_9HYPO|nr:hypothetical protein VHEMI10657 [[Torrubiella] hemipterigena]
MHLDIDIGDVATAQDIPIAYHVYNDKDGGTVDVVGQGVLTENGHMTYSRDGRWLLSDTYPDAQTNIRHLFLWDTKREIRIDIGAFRTDPDLGKENRCDLHPRWSRDGNGVCIDSIHQGPRGLYLVDVSSIVNAG